MRLEPIENNRNKFVAQMAVDQDEVEPFACVPCDRLLHGLVVAPWTIDRNHVDLHVLWSLHSHEVGPLGRFLGSGLNHIQNM